MTWTGEEIKRRRIQLGLNQRQLADAVGVSHSAVGHWERTRQPRITGANRERLDNTLGHPDGAAPRPEPEPQPRRFTSAVAWTPAEIKRRRQILGLKQAEVAERVGASKRAYIGWETEGNPPSNRYLLRMQDVLRLPEDDPDYDAGPPLREASVDEILTYLDAGPLLRDAGFEETMARLIELHNENRERDGLPPVLQVGPLRLPSDLPEHDVVEGPALDGDEPAGKDTPERVDAHRNQPLEG